MHHSDYSKRDMVEVTCYLDDSGSDEEGKVAVLGGLVLARENSFSFSYEWDHLLANHGIKPPVHMREFTSRGKFADISFDRRRALFSDLADLINRKKLYSIVHTVSSLEFQQFFPASKFRRLFGPMPFAFITCALMNHSIVRDHRRLRPMRYLVAESNVDSQILESHTLVQSYIQGRHVEKADGIAFDVPLEVNALQAADMISWSNRRKDDKGELGNGFEPLERLTRNVQIGKRSVPHFDFPVTRKHAEGLAEIINIEDPNPRRIGRLELSKIFFSSQAKNIT